MHWPQVHSLGPNLISLNTRSEKGIFSLCHPCLQFSFQLPQHFVRSRIRSQILLLVWIMRPFIQLQSTGLPLDQFMSPGPDNTIGSDAAAVVLERFAPHGKRFVRCSFACLKSGFQAASEQGFSGLHIGHLQPSGWGVSRRYRCIDSNAAAHQRAGNKHGDELFRCVREPQPDCRSHRKRRSVYWPDPLIFLKQQ